MTLIKKYVYVFDRLQSDGAIKQQECSPLHGVALVEKLVIVLHSIHSNYYSEDSMRPSSHHLANVCKPKVIFLLFSAALAIADQYRTLFSCFII